MGVFRLKNTSCMIKALASTNNESTICIQCQTKKCKLWVEAELLTFHDFDDLNQLLPHYHDSG